MRAVIGVDPHKHVLSAVALDGRGGVLGRWSGSAARPGIRAPQAWAARHAPGAVWAIEGSNSLGRRLALALVAAGADVRDVCPTRTAERRRKRPGRGKTDALDAEAVARELLAAHLERARAPAPDRADGRSRARRRACCRAPGRPRALPRDAARAPEPKRPHTPGRRSAERSGSLNGSSTDRRPMGDPADLSCRQLEATDPAHGAPSAPTG